MIGCFDEKKDFFYENGFYLTSRPYRLGNIMAHYELYKMILDLPGDVLEMGVFKGGTMVQWATFRELLENENSRRIIGFDAFGEFSDACHIDSDKEFATSWNKKFIDQFLSEDDLKKVFLKKGFDNIKLVKGDINITLPKYLEENKSMRISMLHIDTDVYEPCKTSLDLCYDLVVPNGLIVFDDYSVVEGETAAVDEFFSKKKYSLHKFSFSHGKPVYIKKGLG